VYDFGIFTPKISNPIAVLIPASAYTDGVLSLNNSQFSDYLHLIYPNEIELRNTTDTHKSALYLYIYIEIYNGRTLKNKKPKINFSNR